MLAMRKIQGWNTEHDLRSKQQMVLKQLEKLEAAEAA